MLLAEETTEREKIVRYTEPNTKNSINKDGGKHLDVIEVQIVSAGDNSNVLLDESAGCGEPSEDDVVKMDAGEMACTFRSMYENVTPETADDGKKSDGDEPHDDDFSAYDLLRFAWQIAQGMVSNARLFESHSKTWS